MFARAENNKIYSKPVRQYLNEWTMPNVVNKAKTSQLMKMEKENENKDLRRKLKSLHKVTFRSLSERSPGLVNKETVWDRLSRVKKSASNEGNFLLGGKSRTLIPAAKSTLRLQQQQQQRMTTQRTNKKPLTPNTNLNKRVTEKKSVRRIKSKATYLNELDLDMNAFSCKRVKEILTARSICNSKTSSEECSLKQVSARSENVNCLLNDHLNNEYEFEDSEMEKQGESQDSSDDFVVAPLMAVPTTDSLNMSATISSNFRCLLEGRKKNMAPEEIATIKNVVKTDERHRQLQPNDSILFKEILKTQLKEIIRQETVVKSALHNLNDHSVVNIPTTIAIPKPVLALDVEPKKQQVDVIFKNVPTLEKEIIILKALGEKLEATLKRTVSQGDIKLHELNKLATTLETKWHVSHPDNFQFACNEFLSMGVRRCIGLVQEFRMEHKTIVELKEQASHHFYLPSNKDSTELKRTSFKRLKENPDLLMRYLKPKSTLVPFNVLEQDPCFFNSFLYSPCVIGSLESTVSLPKDMHAAEAAPKTPTKEAGDSARSARVPYTYEKEPLQIEEIQCTINEALYNGQQQSTTRIQAEIPTTLEERAVNTSHAHVCLCEAPLRGRKRRRIRRHHTPLSPESNPDPKNNIFKTILVGSVQISVFLLLIMAITYPDVRC
ncbi:uncharacterized protein LOC105215469 isoform X3 [Zeugodacus cucurbitae]|uniref:uncharacterized protein LOC105215469 isoform X3 n=2 Tax=Zeugodacus cucurbitae TaxID=28588 RepID=UPI0023D952E2|nr:uncharacterized protein LOC105215469 isoform X3 [Zeugodacus cucurbitae]